MSVQYIATRRHVTALAWDGDDLVDLADGPDRWSPDGTVDRPRIRRALGSAFDHATVSASGRFQAVYAERGTSAVLLRDGEPVRELSRDDDHSEDFDYPIALGALPDGREVVVHCPDAYNVLQIDDAESGQRLTGGPRTPSDIFHSRLSISPDGRHLLMAGWYWHPYGVAMVFDLQPALADPSALDDRGIVSLFEAVAAEVESACWLDSDRVAIATTADEPPHGDDPNALRPGQLGVWSIGAARWLHRTTIGFRIGTMVRCGDRIMALYGHPRLVDPATGDVVAEWADVDAGAKSGSFGVTHVPTPITALHPDGTRLAVAQPDRIAVLHLPAA
jgi:hypothetical protein